MKYAISSNASKATIPSVSGYSYDLPTGFTMIEAYRGPGWDKEGAYYLTVKALKNYKVISETAVELGKY